MTHPDRDVEVWRVITLWHVRYLARIAAVVAVLSGFACGWVWSRGGMAIAVVFEFDTDGIYETRAGEENLPQAGITSSDVMISWPHGQPWQVNLDLHEDAVAETQYIAVAIRERLKEDPILFLRYTLTGSPVTAEFQVCDANGHPRTELDGNERKRLNSFLLAPADKPKAVEVPLQGYDEGEARQIKILFSDTGKRALGLLSLGIFESTLDERGSPDARTPLPGEDVSPGNAQERGTASGDEAAYQHDGRSGLPPGGARSSWDTLSPAQQQLLVDLEERHLRFFVARRDDASGLVPDRAPPWRGRPLEDRHRIYSVGGMGFAFACWVRAEELGLLERGTAQAWAGKALRTLETAPRERGLLPHFVTATGEAAPGSEFSTIDHSLFLAGLVSLQRFCGDPAELKAPTKRMLDVEWDELVVERGGVKLICMGADSERQLLAPSWDDYNEGILVYALAGSSSQHAVPPQIFDNLARRRFPAAGFASGDEFAGQTLPLFVHQYPALFWGAGPGPRLPGGLDVAENSRKATRFNRTFCRAQRDATFQSGFWGVTACDDPVRGGYHSYHPAPGNAPGVVCPSALLASAGFTPELVAADIQHWARDARVYSRILGDYGFCDSFKIDERGVVTTSEDAISITVGAAALGIAQCRGAGTERWFRDSPVGRRGLEAIDERSAR